MEECKKNEVSCNAVVTARSVAILPKSPPIQLAASAAMALWL